MTVLIRDAAFDVVLTLGDSSMVGGYAVLDGFDEGQRGFRRLTVDAPRVDFEFEVARARSKYRLSLPVVVEGSTPAAARVLHRALLDAVEADVWYLDVAGDGTTAVWTCDAADESAPVRQYEGGRVRVVSLSVPAISTYGF